MMRFLLYALLFWFLYKLIFDFIIPVYRTTRMMKKKFGEMHNQMKEQQMKQPGFNQPSAESKTPSKTPEGDYIDFEEVK
jgi:hypothetical protein